MSIKVLLDVKARDRVGAIVYNIVDKKVDMTIAV